MGRIIGLDLGSKTCGVAISDSTGFLARALTTIRFDQDDYDDCFDQLLELLEKEKIKEVVLGLPKHMNGDVGIRGQLSIDFANELEKEGYHVTLWDERLTTVSAERLLIQGDVSRKKRKKIIDQMAAVQILQNYLDSKNRG
ncbi:Holliday junction resolvase RuvX [Floccifex sp.]|uniref:Holliday junction resolvase RuvX n=1 Tax=Floccifex sp. TaxID=2815810 RepID=UPI002A752605|nr:Holliday junction resolvase RuvX [Floccifex sp.]MDD7281999.1 Holliday junction resolvase RuvX [Erysipelotrichaceae bacterium]MDY2957494.1 Holliday junction resolvase RuvX [Floccifex sp.]